MRRTAVFDMTPELLLRMMPLPDNCEAVGVRYDAERRVVVVVLEGDGRVMAIYHMMSERDIRTALQFPWTSIGSDAGAALTPGIVDGLGLPHEVPRGVVRHLRDDSEHVNRPHQPVVPVVLEARHALIR